MSQQVQTTPSDQTPSIITVRQGDLKKDCDCSDCQYARRFPNALVTILPRESIAAEKERIWQEFLTKPQFDIDPLDY